MEMDLVAACVRNNSAGKINPLQKRSGSRFYDSDSICIRLYGNAPTEWKFKSHTKNDGTKSVKPIINGLYST